MHGSAAPDNSSHWPDMMENDNLATGQTAADDHVFRHMVDSIADYAIMMLDRDGIIRSWNRGAEQMLGYQTGEIVGQHMAVLYGGDDPVDRAKAELLAVGQEGRINSESWRYRKDGSKFWASVCISALHDEAGNLLGYTKLIKDLTDRQRLEGRFRQVVESAPNAMVMVNNRGRIEMLNAQTEQLFGYPRAELLGKLVEILVPERFRLRHPEKRNLYFNEPTSRPMGAGRDLFGRRKDGSEFPIEIGLNPIETEDGTMVLSSIVDISDRKQKEQKIEAALREKDLLLGEIHHRVKNNLQVVHSLLNLQASVINDPTVRGMLMDSQNRIQSMALIHQTLYQSNDFAKVEFAEFLGVLIPTLVSSYGVDEQRIKISFESKSVSLPITRAIPCGLLINELITNSLKHAFPRNMSGEISVRLKRGLNARILLEIDDNGVGIPESLDIDKVETLGLRLVTLLSQQMDGTLTIRRSDPTRFAVEFPADEQ